MEEACARSLARHAGRHAASANCARADGGVGDVVREQRASLTYGIAAPFNAPVDAARLARSCCKTCDDVARALTAVSVWLTELHSLSAPPQAQASSNTPPEEGAGDGPPPAADSAEVVSVQAGDDDTQSASEMAPAC